MAETPSQPQRSKSGQFTKKGEESLAKAKTLTKEGNLETSARDRSTVDAQFAKIAELKQERISELETLNEAVEFQKSEIERLRGVETAALSIEEANLKLEATKAENARKLAEHQKDLASKLEEARIENNQKVQQFEIDRARIQSAWNYSFEQQKKAAQDQLNEEIRVARQAEKIRAENLEREWQLREQALKAQETELIDLRAKAASFEAEKDKAVAAAESKAFNIAKKDKEHEIAILTAQHTAQRTVDQNTIQNLNMKLADKDEIIKQLTVQLSTATKAQETIATKALETAANRQALADQQTTAALTNGGQKRA
jgi:hypothetical protein